MYEVRSRVRGSQEVYFATNNEGRVSEISVSEAVGPDILNLVSR